MASGIIDNSNIVTHETIISYGGEEKVGITRCGKLRIINYVAESIPPGDTFQWSIPLADRPRIFTRNCLATLLGKNVFLYASESGVLGIYNLSLEQESMAYGELVYLIN